MNYIIKVEETAQGFKVSFPYNAKLVADIKLIKGREWNANGKYWFVPKNKQDQLDKFLEKYGGTTDNDIAFLQYCYLSTYEGKAVLEPKFPTSTEYGGKTYVAELLLQKSTLNRIFHTESKGKTLTYSPAFKKKKNQIGVILEVQFFEDDDRTRKYYRLDEDGWKEVADNDDISDASKLKGFVECEKDVLENKNNNPVYRQTEEDNVVVIKEDKPVPTPPTVEPSMAVKKDNLNNVLSTPTPKKSQSPIDQELEEINRQIQEKASRINNQPIGDKASNYKIVKQQPNKEGLVAYRPLSKGNASGVFVTASMGFETQVALYNLSVAIGDVDDYVARNLMMDKSDLFKVLYAEQIDGVALAMSQISNNRGMVIGDQTGVGKGRQAAAIIRYGVKNGTKVIFITENAALFTDMYRDLRDIKSDDVTPFIFNNDVQEATIMYDDEISYAKKLNNSKYGVLSTSEVNRILSEKLKEKDFTTPEGRDFVMLTYSQINSSKKDNPKIEFLKSFAQDAIVIMDEAHNSSGSGSNVGMTISKMLSVAKGCCYLSATFAKRPDNMPIYAVKTSLQDTGLSYIGIVNLFEKGGVPMQEIAASELCKAGQMVRKQRSSEGVEVVWKYLSEQKDEHFDRLDEIVDVMYSIGDFQRKFIHPYLQALNEAREDAYAKQYGSKQDLGIKYNDFFSVAHNLVGQLMFSLKAKDVAQEAIKLLNENKKVVIAFMRTNGSFLQELGYKDGEAVSRIDFGLLLERAFDKTLKYELTAPDGTITQEKLTYEELSQDFESKYRLNEIVKKIDAIASTDLTISPIDDLIRVIQSASKPKDLGGHSGKNYVVRECTGRAGRIRYDEEGNAFYESFKSNKKIFFAEFNNGKADVLLINQSAATGVSAHASSTFADQRQRWMIIHEPELDISKEVQKRGRINRTGQVVPPGYLYVSTLIPSEQRVFMVLQNKLKKLDANTTGNQKNSKSLLDVLDFYNEYGGEVIHEYLQFDNEQLNERLNDPCYSTKETKDGKIRIKLSNTDIPQRVTNRLQLMDVQTQTEFYDTVIDAYKEKVQRLKELGEYNLELETLDFNAKILKRYLKVQGTGAPNTFGMDGFVELHQTQTLKKPYTLAKIKELATQNIGKSKSFEKYYEKIERGFLGYYEALEVQQIQKLEELIADNAIKIKQNQEKIVELSSQADTLDQQNKLKAAIQKLQEKQENFLTKLNNEKLLSEAVKQEVLAFINFYTPMKVIKLLLNIDESTTQDTYGVVIGIEIRDDVKYPFNHKNMRLAIAVPTTLQEMKLPLTSPLIKRNYYTNKNTDSDKLQALSQKWDDMSSESGKNSEYHLIVGAGNIFNSFIEYPNRLVKYTTSNNEVLNGILYPRLKPQTVFPTTPEEVNERFFIETKLLNEGRDGSKQYDSILLASLQSFVNSHPIFNLKNGQTYDITLKVTDKLERVLTIRKERSGSVINFIVQPKLFKDLILDDDILQYAIPTEEEKRLNLKGSFQTYNQGNQFARFNETDLKGLVDILVSKYNLRINSSVPVEVDMNKSLYLSATPITETDNALLQLSWQSEALQTIVQKKDIPNNMQNHTYFVSQLKPSDYIKIGKINIDNQPEIVAQFGEPLVISKVINNIALATENYTLQEPKAIETDLLVKQLLVEKGVVESDSALAEGKPVPAEVLAEYHGSKTPALAKDQSLTVKIIEPNRMIYKADKLGKIIPNSKVIKGKEIRLSLPNGEVRPAQYAIVEAADIIASHNEETFGSSKFYPVNKSGYNINDRNYTGDKQAQSIVADYAKNLKPELVITTSKTPSGSPIISQEGFVVSGNNRTMSIKLAINQYPEKYENYLNELKEEYQSFGFEQPIGELSNFKHPVLVRVDYGFLENYSTQELAKYNQSETKGKRPVDKAIELSNVLMENVSCSNNIPLVFNSHEKMSDFYANRADQKRMIGMILQCNLLTPQEISTYYDEQNGFTDTGKDFLETTLASIVLNRDALMASEKDGMKRLRQMVVTTLPTLMQNRALGTNASLIPLINQAIRYELQLKSSELRFSDFISQNALFIEEKVSPSVIYMNRLMNTTRNTFKKAISGYNESLSASGGSMDMFGTQVTPKEAFDGYIVAALDKEDVRLIKAYEININKSEAVQPTPPKQEVTKEKLLLRAKAFKVLADLTTGDEKSKLLQRAKAFELLAQLK